MKTKNLILFIFLITLEAKSQLVGFGNPDPVGLNAGVGLTAGADSFALGFGQPKPFNLDPSLMINPMALTFGDGNFNFTQQASGTLNAQPGQAYDSPTCREEADLKRQSAAPKPFQDLFSQPAFMSLNMSTALFRLHKFNFDFGVTNLEQDMDYLKRACNAKSTDELNQMLEVSCDNAKFPEPTDHGESYNTKMVLACACELKKFKMFTALDADIDQKLPACAKYDKLKAVQDSVMESTNQDAAARKYFIEKAVKQNICEFQKQRRKALGVMIHFENQNAGVTQTSCMENGLGKAVIGKYNESVFQRRADQNQDPFLGAFPAPFLLGREEYMGGPISQNYFNCNNDKYQGEIQAALTKPDVLSCLAPVDEGFSCFNSTEMALFNSLPIKGKVDYDLKKSEIVKVRNLIDTLYKNAWGDDYKLKLEEKRNLIQQKEYILKKLANPMIIGAEETMFQAQLASIDVSLKKLDFTIKKPDDKSGLFAPYSAFYEYDTKSNLQVAFANITGKSLEDDTDYYIAGLKDLIKNDSISFEQTYQILETVNHLESQIDLLASSEDPNQVLGQYFDKEKAYQKSRNQQSTVQESLCADLSSTLSTGLCNLELTPINRDFISDYIADMNKNPGDIHSKKMMMCSMGPIMEDGNAEDTSKEEDLKFRYLSSTRSVYDDYEGRAQIASDVKGQLDGFCKAQAKKCPGRSTKCEADYLADVLNNNQDKDYPLIQNFLRSIPKIRAIAPSVIRENILDNVTDKKTAQSIYQQAGINYEEYHSRNNKVDSFDIATGATPDAEVSKAAPIVSKTADQNANRLENAEVLPGQAFVQNSRPVASAVPVVVNNNNGSSKEIKEESPETRAISDKLADLEKRYQSLQSANKDHSKDAQISDLQKQIASLNEELQTARSAQPVQTAANVARVAPVVSGPNPAENVANAFGPSAAGFVNNSGNHSAGSNTVSSGNSGSGSTGSGVGSQSSSVMSGGNAQVATGGQNASISDATRAAALNPQGAVLDPKAKLALASIDNVSYPVYKSEAINIDEQKDLIRTMSGSFVAKDQLLEWLQKTYKLPKGTDNFIISDGKKQILVKMNTISKKDGMEIVPQFTEVDGLVLSEADLLAKDKVGPNPASEAPEAAPAKRSGTRDELLKDLQTP